MSSTNELKGLSDKIKEIQKTAADEGKAMILKAAQEIFTRFPALRLITWKQYTPYFNDGDPCEFGVDDIYAIADVEGEDRISDDELDDYCGYDAEEAANVGGYNKSDKLPQELHQAFNDFRGAIRSLENLMEYIFGDHVQIKFTKGGMTVNEFDHS